jgi:hypothetical protein
MLAALTPDEHQEMIDAAPRGNRGYDGKVSAPINSLNWMCLTCSGDRSFCVDNAWKRGRPIVEKNGLTS